MQARTQSFIFQFNNGQFEWRLLHVQTQIFVIIFTNRHLELQFFDGRAPLARESGGLPYWQWHRWQCPCGNVHVAGVKGTARWLGMATRREENVNGKLKNKYGDALIQKINK
jgi:hypothetical protein